MKKLRRDTSTPETPDSWPIRIAFLLAIGLFVTAVVAVVLVSLR